MPRRLRNMLRSLGFDDATARLARSPPHSIVFAVAISSYLLGVSGEEEFVIRVEARSNGVLARHVGERGSCAHSRGGAERITLLHGLWFNDDADQKAVTYLGGSRI